MKIAYILYPGAIVSNRSNGIRSQAETWAKQLVQHGHTVDLISTWGDYNWKKYDIIHFFKGGAWMPKLAGMLSVLNPNIVWSPIIDPYQDLSMIGKLKERFVNIISSGLFRTNVYFEKENSRKSKAVLVRSEYEKLYVNKNFKPSLGKTHVVPLSCSPSVLENMGETKQKENFCLHISSIYQKRKNVINLVRAAKKYGFELVLAGNKGTAEQFAPLVREIGNAPNIKVLGFITEEQKVDLYKRAKVFALPSTNEGVGIVALDAAFYGCEIVITNIEGPKEYYDKRCIEVDPSDVDQIGSAIDTLMKGKQSFQPELKAYVLANYTPDNNLQKLIHVYEGVIGGNPNSGQN